MKSPEIGHFTQRTPSTLSSSRKGRLRGGFLLGFVILALLLLLQALAGFNAYAANGPNDSPLSSDAPEPLTNVNPNWTWDLPSRNCPDGSNDCHVPSPVLADITSDGRADVVVATSNGHVVALKHNGTLLWDKDTAPYFGMAPGTQEIFSSPSIGDVDSDGYPEIVVGAGTTYRSRCTQGGVIVLDRNGNVKPGWPKLTKDLNGDGCRETVYSTPALGDLTKDGYLEIVVGSFDKRIYAWRHDGTLLPGFPPDSYLHQRFPTWPNLVGKLADTIWSSPALADIDGDGYLDIVIGSDEGNFDSSWPGDSGGWTCPYALPSGWPAGYCGGSLYAIDRFGDILPGFPRYILEIIQSTPAVADVNDDGWQEIFVGTGTFYRDNSPDHPTNGFRVFGLDRFGNDLPGWAGGKVVGNSVTASPSIGDITGDGSPEIVVAALDRKLYAWHVNGQPVSGFPMTPVDHWGNTWPFGSGFVLADSDGDGKMEILFNMHGIVAIVNGNGQLMTANPSNYGLPAYRSYDTNLNAPAVADMDNDGKLELVANNSTLYVWELSNSTTEADWPMYRRVARRSGAFPQLPWLQAVPGQLTIMHQSGTHGNATTTMVVSNAGGQSLNWSASTPSGVSITPSSGTLSFGQSTLITVSASTSGFSRGTHPLGNIIFTATSSAGAVQNSPSSHPVTLVVGDISQIFLPLSP